MNIKLYLYLKLYLFLSIQDKKNIVLISAWIGLKSA